MTRLSLREWNSCAHGHAASKWESLTLNHLSVLALVRGGGSGWGDQRGWETHRHMLWLMETMVWAEKGLAEEPLKTQYHGGRAYAESFSALRRIRPGIGMWQPLEFKSYYKSVIFRGWWSRTQRTEKIQIQRQKEQSVSGMLPKSSLCHH